ncbi:hypothetical protein [Streptomyces canus]|uniref:hypothetical protein n=1 Tax=Streptomyces canus TaxID=58343 RepID=UPI0033BC60A8
MGRRQDQAGDRTRRQALARPLTVTHRGHQALEDAGLGVTTKTLINWLSDPEDNIRRSYRDIIHTAYENAAIVPADPIPNHLKRGQYEISGIVKTGDDERERGTRRAAPCASTPRTPPPTAREPRALCKGSLTPSRSDNRPPTRA